MKQLLQFLDLGNNMNFPEKKLGFALMYSHFNQFFFCYFRYVEIPKQYIARKQNIT